jgi:hypothetical protein
MNASSKLRSVTAVEKLSPIIELRRFSDQRTRGTTSFATTLARRTRTVKQFCVDYGVGKTPTCAEIKAGRLRAVKVGFKAKMLARPAENGFQV